MLTKFSAKLHTFHWNSNFLFGKFQYFNVFIGNYIQEIADELSPEVVRSVQQYLSEHKELNIPMGNIKERYSRTMNETYLSFGCPHCDAIVGDHYLFDLKIDYAYEEDDESVLDIPLLGSGVNLEKKHFVIKCP